MNQRIRKLIQGTRERSRTRERGSAVVIAMVFAAIFLMIGLALYWLVASQTRAAELERTDVKSFNVAEAGIDAGMLTLKRSWPRTYTLALDMTDYSALLKTTIQEGAEGLWDPTRSDPSEFIQVLVYDNVDSEGNTTTVAYPSAATYDSNRDNIMFVDSTSNVYDDRHRILIRAQRESWGLDFDCYAVVTDIVDSNGQGLVISIDDGDLPVWAYVGDAVHKDTNYEDGVTEAPAGTSFEDLIDAGLAAKIMLIAQNMGTYYDDSGGEFDNSDTFIYDTTAGGEASGFLESGDANGTIIYVKSDSAVDISGKDFIGSKDSPILVVIDTPSGSENSWDMSGNTEFYGIVIVLGNASLEGTCGIYGSLYVQGTLINKGTGASGEINYSQTVINNINDQYTLSVKLLANSWEEYALPTE